MAKYYGKIGFRETIETVPDVYVEKITERNYYGDVLSDAVRVDASDKINKDISVSKRISIILDTYAEKNCFDIVWCEFMGKKWSISSVDIYYPRLILSLGGIYNE